MTAYAHLSMDGVAVLRPTKALDIPGMLELEVQYLQLLEQNPRAFHLDLRHVPTICCSAAAVIISLLRNSQDHNCETQIAMRLESRASFEEFGVVDHLPLVEEFSELQ